MRAWIMMTVLLLPLLAGCPQRPPPTPGAAGSTTLPGTPTALDDATLDGPIIGCADALQLINQTITMPMVITLDAGGIVDRVGVVTVGASYTFSTRPVNPLDCTPLPQLPASPPVTITFGYNYLGDFSRVNPLCMNASSMAFTAFAISGTPLDALLEEFVRDQIWRETDRQMASRFHAILNGSPFPVTASGRCSNWINLGP